MPAIRDDHVFVEDTDAHVAYIAAGLGITAAHIGASTVGEFALE
ncbi:HVO_0234 family beta-propeller protein, partial [Halobacterium salinarum]